jgi:predicted acylesterase/phospholipase RssA
MKGGITSGVVYPKALHAIGSHYRIRGIGGASAGAIGAAIGAAAEFGRASGGYDRLATLPSQLGEGRLAALFQPQRSTRQLLRLMLTASGSDRPGPPRKRRALAVLFALMAVFPLASLIGVAPGVALIVVGVVSGGWAGWLLAVAGLLLAKVGWAVAVVLRLMRKLTVDVPQNLFGICRGMGRGADHPGFTDWLCDQIDDVAALPAEFRPMRFGHLWTGTTTTAEVGPRERRTDLRMITTCLSEGRPYEMPWEARRFFYDPAAWRTLFPEHVIAALEAAPPPEPPEDAETWRWEEQVAANHQPALRRLPDAQFLPVIVATRLSLSFPLLISAVPLWSVDRRHAATRETARQFRAAQQAGSPPPTTGLHFIQLWFTDGGLCSNFPVHLFDAALPSRPTFAINLGRFGEGREADADQRRNVEWARSNRSGLLPQTVDIPTSGFGAVGGFASAALNTARNWPDNTHLDHPGYRDRIVRVLQTKLEGGLNLFMDAPTIERLADRGETAGKVMVEQFTQPKYPEREPTATGWDNHRWVRYRALLSVLPDWIRSYAGGRAVFDLDVTNPPSYGMTVGGRELASRLAETLDELAEIVGTADEKAMRDLISAPRPRGILRRIPQT